MGRVVWSDQSRRDFKQRFARIAADSLTVAKNWQRRVKQMVAQLAFHPRIGSPVPFDHHEIREQIVFNDRIIYLVEGSNCTILRVVRGERELSNDEILDESLN